MAKLSEKDQKIIAQNPDTTDPVDLLHKGLSEQGFNLLVAQQKGKQQTDVKAGKPVLTPNLRHILQPSLDTPAPVSGRSGGKARLIPKSGGNGTVMSKVQAEQMVKRYPHQFKLG